MLATVQQYGNVKLWQVTDETASEFADLGGLIDVRSIAWRADGQQLAMTGSQDYDREQGGMVLWDIDGSRVSQVATLPGQPGHSMHAVWLEEMPMLASVTMRGAVKVWSTEVAQWKQRACLAANRNMTMDEWEDAMGDAPYAKTCPAFPVHATVVYAQMQAAEQLAQAGDILTATQQFSEALTLDPTLAFTPSIRAKQTYAAALLKEGLQLAQAGDILTATQKYSAALTFDPTLVFMPSIRAKQIYAAALVKEGAQLAQAGDVLTATQKYSAALTFDPTLTLHPRVQAERVYAEALVKAGEELARAGDVLTATQKYSAALTFDPTLTISPSVQAGQQYADILIRAGANLASVGNILTATQKYSAALMFHPTLSLTPTVVVATIYANSLVDNAIMQASLGNIITATHMFSEALVIHPTADIQANRRRALCHYGVVNGQAAAVLSTCNQAVAGATDGEERAAMRLYRGIGYALTGNTSGAIEDLEATLTWTEDVEEYVQLTIAIPAWIEALQQGENPFTEEVLRKFR
jgi:tetratricopeptide (TPR) repeat protein